MVSTSTPLSPLDSPDDVSVDPDTEAQAVDDRSPEREIVVGVDGGECALGAVRWAAREAVRRNAPLRIVHVADYLGRPAVPGAPPPELRRARQITAQAYTAARHTDRAVQASTEILPGDAADVLLEATADAQLVVLGSSTTGAADEMVLAPVALRVAARSPRPVVVVPRTRGAGSSGRPVVAMLGLGEAEDDDAVIGLAADAARSAGAPLLLLRARGRTAAEGSGQAAADGDPRLADLDVRTADLSGAPPNALLGAACPSPLVVLCAGQGSLLHRSLDSPHRWLLRHCTSPMALIPSRRQAGADADAAR